MNWPFYPLSFDFVGSIEGRVSHVVFYCTEYRSKESTGFCCGFRLCFSWFACEVSLRKPLCCCCFLGKGSCKRLSLQLMKVFSCRCELLVGESDLRTGPVLISPATVFLGVGEKEQMFYPDCTSPLPCVNC